MGLSGSVITMKIELCSFSGFKIYPGHGKRHVTRDGRPFVFINAKSEKSHLMKRNPRKINWTVLYRRKHKKGQQEEVSKKRTRRTAKFQRAITGASLADIMAKRNLKYARLSGSRPSELPRRSRRQRLPLSRSRRL